MRFSTTLLLPLLTLIVLAIHIAAKSTIPDIILDITALSILAVASREKATDKSASLVRRMLTGILYSLESKARGSNANAVYAVYEKLNSVAKRREDYMRPIVAKLLRGQIEEKIAEAPFKTVVLETFGKLYETIALDVSRAEDRSSIVFAVIMLTSTMLGLLYGFNGATNSTHTMIAFMLLSELLARRLTGYSGYERV